MDVWKVAALQPARLGEFHCDAMFRLCSNRSRKMPSESAAPSCMSAQGQAPTLADALSDDAIYTIACAVGDDARPYSQRRNSTLRWESPAAVAAANVNALGCTCKGLHSLIAPQIPQLKQRLVERLKVAETSLKPDTLLLWRSVLLQPDELPTWREHRAASWVSNAATEREIAKCFGGEAAAHTPRRRLTQRRKIKLLSDVVPPCRIQPPPARMMVDRESIKEPWYWYDLKSAADIDD